MNTRIQLSDIWLGNLLSCLFGDHYEVKVTADSDCLYAEILGPLRFKHSYGNTMWLLVTIEHKAISFEWGKVNTDTIPSMDEMVGFFKGLLRASASSLDFDVRTFESTPNYIKFTLNL